MIMKFGVSPTISKLISFTSTPSIVSRAFDEELDELLAAALLVVALLVALDAAALLAALDVAPLLAAALLADPLAAADEDELLPHPTNVTTDRAAHNINAIRTIADFFIAKPSFFVEMSPFIIRCNVQNEPTAQLRFRTV
jgi:hypothetical protein